MPRDVFELVSRLLLPQRSLSLRVGMVWCLLAVATRCGGQVPGPGSDAFVNFETAPVHPIALSPEGNRLAVCNLADGKVEILGVSSGRLFLLGSVPVGIDPVSVRFRDATEAWVVNHISDSVSVVEVNALRVRATIDTLDTPADVVFAGTPPRAFVSCALPNTVQVFDLDTGRLLTNVVIQAERPKALAASPDGRTVYAAIFESGNATTLVGSRFRNLLFFDNAVSRADGPYGGRNPPPNLGNDYDPPLNPVLPGDVPLPATGLIVRKNAAGRWLDGNERDWTEWVSGTNAFWTQRVPGWDLPDRDVALLDAADYAVTYATGLMNICMGLAVNPASGRLAVVGSDALNEVRFEPNLRGTFLRVKLAFVDPSTLEKTVQDLNPHLDYAAGSVPAAERDQSIGDPRAIAWTADGRRGYVAGVGSRNLVVIDAEGHRLRPEPIEVGEGPCGLALDEARRRLYVFNRFSSSISVVDTATDTVVDAVPLFDPTPLSIAAGRRHFYDTRRTSGLGQASCASCHIDARTDRLGWDLGNPAGDLLSPIVNHQGTLVTNIHHPMKGVMVTQTLQDIIGHEPFHWRGDRPDLESFNATFTNLQGAAAALTASQMRELREFLASVRFPPNPYRLFDNSLSTNLPLPGHTALGEGQLPANAPLPDGNAVAGLAVFNQPGNFCVTCHSLPTGLGLDSAIQEGVLKAIPAGPNGEHHFPLAFRLEGVLRSKIAQFRNLADKIGMDTTRTESRAGFGFGHDASVDSLTRFLNGLRVVPDQDVADLIAFLLSVSGSDTGTPGAPLDPSPPAAAGRQVTLTSAGRPALVDAMLALARSPTGRVDLVAKGIQDGLARGWCYDRARNLFQSDRQGATESPESLLDLAGPGTELTFTVVPRGAGVRLGIDRDLDGRFDRDELDAGSDPADRPSRVRVLAASTEAAIGADVLLEAQMGALPAAPTEIAWRKDGQLLAGATQTSLAITNVSLAAAGDYTVGVATPFQLYTSSPVRLTVLPLVVAIAPAAQAVRQGSNALWAATASGLGPFRYQWQFNGQDLPGAASASLVVSDAQLADEGLYRVVVANAFGVVTSGPARLGLLINPAVQFPPLSQRVVAGGNATFGCTISGHPPPFGYLLRKSSLILTNYATDERSAFLTLGNVRSSDAGTYRIVVTNAANPSPGLSLDPVTLTVLPDSDQDGLPDDWEAAHGLDASNAADAQFDSDLDGQANWQEYIAGTDPRDPCSVFRLESAMVLDGQPAAVVQFHAVSNKTYTVQTRRALTGDTWSKAADWVGVATNRPVSFTNPIPRSETRYYRLATPRTP